MKMAAVVGRSLVLGTSAKAKEGKGKLFHTSRQQLHFTANPRANPPGCVARCRCCSFRGPRRQPAAGGSMLAGHSPGCRGAPISAFTWLHPSAATGQQPSSLSPTPRTNHAWPALRWAVSCPNSAPPTRRRRRNNCGARRARCQRHNARRCGGWQSGFLDCRPRSEQACLQPEHGSGRHEAALRRDKGDGAISCETFYYCQSTRCATPRPNENCPGRAEDCITACQNAPFSPNPDALCRPSSTEISGQSLERLQGFKRINPISS